MMNLADDSSTTAPNEKGRPNGSGRSSLRLSLIASVVLHVVFVAALLVWYFPLRPIGGRAATADSPVIAETETRRSEDLAGDSSTPVADDVPLEQIGSSVQSAIESSTRISDERKLDQLQRNVQRLEQVASEASIADIGHAVRSAAGLEQRASMPASEAVEGGFDFDSAQFHDVTRQADQNGNWVYRSVLLDAKGRTFEVDLNEAEGKTAYDTMQMVKASPFAEAIYRSMVMPMMDKMIPKVSPTTDSAAGYQSLSVPTERQEIP
jgi:hypothetical protein